MSQSTGGGEFQLPSTDIDWYFFAERDKIEQAIRTAPLDAILRSLPASPEARFVAAEVHDAVKADAPDTQVGYADGCKYVRYGMSVAAFAGRVAGLHDLIDNPGLFQPVVENLQAIPLKQRPQFVGGYIDNFIVRDQAFVGDPPSEPIHHYRAGQLIEGVRERLYMNYDFDLPQTYAEAGFYVGLRALESQLLAIREAIRIPRQRNTDYPSIHEAVDELYATARLTRGGVDELMSGDRWTRSERYARRYVAMARRLTPKYEYAHLINDFVWGNAVRQSGSIEQDEATLAGIRRALRFASRLELPHEPIFEPDRIVETSQTMTDRVRFGTHLAQITKVFSARFGWQRTEDLGLEYHELTRIPYRTYPNLVRFGTLSTLALIDGAQTHMRETLQLMEATLFSRSGA